MVTTNYCDILCLLADSSDTDLFGIAWSSSSLLEVGWPDSNNNRGWVFSDRLTSNFLYKSAVFISFDIVMMCQLDPGYYIRAAEPDQTLHKVSCVR